MPQGLEGVEAVTVQLQELLPALLGSSPLPPIEVPAAQEVQGIDMVGGQFLDALQILPGLLPVAAFQIHICPSREGGEIAGIQAKGFGKTGFGPVAVAALGLRGAPGLPEIDIVRQGLAGRGKGHGGGLGLPGIALTPLGQQVGPGLEEEGVAGLPL